MPTLAPRTPPKSPSQGRRNAVGARRVGEAVAIQGMICEELGGIGPVHQTLFTFTNCSLTIPDATAYLGTKIYDFPVGQISVSGCSFRGTLTTTSVIASTLNSGVAVSLGVGSATASNVTLSSTMMNFLPGSGETASGFTSSTTINVASAVITKVLAANVSAAHLAATVDGSGTAVDLYFNLAVATATDIDADATVAVNGTLLVTWTNHGPSYEA